MIRAINPEKVNIGSDSENNNLTEPIYEKIYTLAYELRKFTKVVEKSNLRRIFNTLSIDSNK
jgi:predicted nucleotidyltransferase